VIKKIVFGAVILLVLGISYFAVAYIYPSDLGPKKVSIIIQYGDSFPSIAQKLVEQGVVRSLTMLDLGARFSGVDRKLTPGRYDFTGRNSCRSVLGKLAVADFLRIKVTVFEGATIWRVASVLAEKMEVDSAEVVALNTDTLFLQSLDLPYLEGYLYPETYIFPWGTELRVIVEAMTDMYARQTEKIWTDSIPNGLNRDELLILASIVEAEALLSNEMPRIASVYHNRLSRKMKLDADPTVIYGLGGLDRPLSRRDLRQSTPYNTYRKRGLPPTPINSPSRAAIVAALSPEESPYLYFVADGTGGHRFSRTNAEHNRARREIRQGLKKSES